MSCKKSFVFSWLLLFVVVFAMNVLTPLSYGDDYAYAFTMTEPNHLFNMDRPIRNLWDILLSQWNHWLSFNGRFTPHFLLQLFVGILGKDVFNVFNALVFCCVVWLFISLSDFRDKVIGILLIFSAYLLLMPSLSEIFLWTAGSLNYLWTSFFVFLFLLFVRKNQYRKISFKHFVVAPVVLFAGWTNEVMTLPVTMVICLYVLFHFKTIWSKAIMPYLLFFVIGTLLDVFAPSTFQKANAEGFAHLLVGTVGKVKTLLIQIFHLKIFWILCFSLLAFGWKDKKRIVFYLKNNVWLILLLICSFCPILLSGMVDNRIRYGTECFSLLLFLRLLNEYAPFELIHKKVFMIVGLVVCIFLIPVFYFQYENFTNWRICEKQLADPSKNVILTPEDNIFGFWSQYVRKQVLFRGENYFLPCDKERKETRSVSAFYGKKDMFFFPMKLWEEIDSSSAHKSGNFNTNYELYFKELENGDNFSNINIRIDEALSSDFPFYLVPIKKYIQRYQKNDYSIDNFCTIEIKGKHLLVTPALSLDLEKRIRSIDLIKKDD